MENKLTRQDIYNKAQAMLTAISGTEFDSPEWKDALELTDNEYHTTENILTTISEAVDPSYSYGTIEYDKPVTDWEDIDAQLLEATESNTPIYNADLMEWLAKRTNHTAVEDYVDNTGAEMPNGFNFMELIRARYNWTLNQEAQNTLTNIINKLNETK